MKKKFRIWGKGDSFLQTSRTPSGYKRGDEDGAMYRNQFREDWVIPEAPLVSDSSVLFDLFALLNAPSEAEINTEVCRRESASNEHEEWIVLSESPAPISSSLSANPSQTYVDKFSSGYKPTRNRHIDQVKDQDIQSIIKR